MTKSKQKRIYNKWRQKQEALLTQAAMNEFELNTNVLQSVDNSLRVLDSPSYEPMWGDCLSIMFRRENDPLGQWLAGHFSPARAKIFAYHLLMRAEMLEAQTGKVNIDKPVK